MYELATIENNLYQHDKALIDVQIATAKAYPRNIMQCISNIKALIISDVETAQSCIYTLPKGKTVKGPSINLAKMIVQEYGNIRIEDRIVGYDETHVTCEATCFDLEKNLAKRTTIRRSILNKDGDRYSEDLIVTTGNATSAIALRNAILTVVGKQVVDQLFKTATLKIVGDVSTGEKLKAKATDVVNGLIKIYHSKKLTEQEILRTIKKESISHITTADILSLVGFEETIKTGEVSFDEIFRPITARPVPPSSESSSEKRLLLLIKSAKDIESLKKFEVQLTSNDHRVEYDAKMKELKEK